MEASSRTCWSLKCSDFGFQPDISPSINVPQCGINVVLYFIYRCTVFLYFNTYMIFDLVTTINGFDGVRTFIYLTTWVYLLFNLYVFVSFINTLIDAYLFFKRRGDLVEGTPTRLKLQWFLFNIVLNGSVVITFTFWILYYTTPTIQIFFTNMVRNINLHLLPAIFALIDLLTTSTPIRFVHVIYPIFLGLAYLTFAVIYWKAGGTNPWGLPFIYPSLDFGDDPREAIIFSVALIAATILCQVVVKGLYLLREWLTHSNNPSYTALDGTNSAGGRPIGSAMELPNR
ncbi:protein rolling stone-like [Lytechinus variegatus]|uniref:protein rolling stone-like n=1 Tax=Lytechinus variegatus TaxID=7654 RepID=UPI001BB1A0C9|nr:protein rolling stone-like [Lytechinus variegatus]